MAAFGFGQAGEGLKNAAFGTFLLFFYNQIVGVSGTLTGLALAIALMFDAITDPLAGAVSDRTRSRWARRHPYIIAAALPLAVTLFLLFNPPAGLSELEYFVWLTLFAVLVRASMTFYHIPHLALGAEMAHDYNQRSTLFAFSTLFGASGGAIGAAVAYRVFFPTTEEFNPGLLNPDGYFGFSVAFGAAIVFTIVVSFLGTFREIPYLKVPETKPSALSVRNIVTEVLEAFHNRSFRAIFLGMLLGTLIISIEGVLQPFMGIHFWGLTTEQLSLIPLVALVGLLLALPLTPMATRVFDKKRALLTTAAIVIVNGNVLIVMRLLNPPWFPTNESPWVLYLVLISVFVSTTLAPIIFSTLNSMFADITDEHELETGERREGIIFAARAFAAKATAAIGVSIGGVILDVIEFPRGGAPLGTVQDEVIWKLGFAQGPATSVFTLCGLLLYLGYRLDRQRHAEILRELEARRKARDASEAAS
jgi:GPH family glycoside/pentoside/hexuronide:cation symporter